MKILQLICSIIALPLALMAVANTSFAEDGKLKGHQIATKFRLIHFDREFEDPIGDHKQSALGVELNYTTPQYGDTLGAGVSGYLVQDISDSGAIREDVLTVDDGELDGFEQFGQAYLNLTPGDKFSLKLGRLKTKSIFLASSGSRAVPSTFQGVDAAFQPITGLSIYGGVFDEWSRRTRDDFEEFATDQSAQGDIDYVAVIGAGYKTDSYTVEGEYYESKDYLNKLGIRGSYIVPLTSSILKISGAVFTSSDDGDLFVTQSESGDLDDEDIAGSVAGVTPSDNDGLGAYINVGWSRDNLQLSAALTKIDEIWLEDNFAGDHGTNPFPTSSVLGADLTNSNETVIRLKAAYDWKDYLPGLKTTLAFADGSDAENSVDRSLGTADEQWWELKIVYASPKIKGLKATAIWHDYESDEVGSVDGVKEDNQDLRLYLDYVHTFM